MKEDPKGPELTLGCYFYPIGDFVSEVQCCVPRMKSVKQFGKTWLI